MVSSNDKTGNASSRKTRSPNRPKHIIAAETIGNMGADDTANFVNELVNNRPVAAEFLQLQLNNALATKANTSAS